jgi:hypothetical protein
MRRRTGILLLSLAGMAALLTGAALLLPSWRRAPPRSDTIEYEEQEDDAAEAATAPATAPAAAKSAAPPSKPGVAQGPSRPEELVLRIVDKLDGSPLAGVAILATPLRPSLDPDGEATSVTAETDANGHARLDLDPLAGGYRITFTREGRATLIRDYGTGVGTAFGTSEVGMSLAGTIEGRVLDANGRPVAGAVVYADGATGERHRNRIHLPGLFGEFPAVAALAPRIPSTASLPDGTYRLEGMPVGQPLDLFAVAAGWSPSAQDLGFQIPAGEVLARRDLTLLRDTSVVVRFVGTDGAGTTEAVRAWIVSRLGYLPLFAAPSGVHEAAGLDPGTQTIVVAPERSALGHRLVDLVEGERTLVELPLLPGPILSGSVTSEDGTTRAGVVVEARGTIPGIVAAIPLREATTDEDGRFSLTGIERKLAMLTVRGPVTGFLHDQDGEKTLAGLRLRMPAAFRATLQPTGGAAFGKGARARAWAVEVGRSARLRPLDQPGNLSFDRATGALAVAELPCGTVTLRIAVDGFALYTRQHELPAGEVTDLGTIPLEAGHALAGEVFAPDGKGQPGVRVRAWYPNGECPTTYTTSTGRFGFRSLRAAAVVLEFHDAVSFERRFALETRVAVVGPSATPVRMDMREGGDIQVQIRRGDGQPPMSTHVGCDPGGVGYRPLPEAFVPLGGVAFLGRRPAGPGEVVLFDPRGVRVASAPVQVVTGRRTFVTLWEP